MKKLSLLLFVILIATSTYSQRKSIYISSELTTSFQLFIDDELQSYGLGSNYKLNGLTAGKKTLSIRTQTNPQQTATIEVGGSNDKIEYYSVIKQDGKFTLVKKPEFKFKKDINPTFCNYISKRIAVKMDSNYKQPHTCKVTDSSVNLTIQKMAQLKDKKARETLLNSTFGRKCLQSSQMKSIGYRMSDDKERYDFYMKYYKTCIDNAEFKVLHETFSHQEYANQFETWLKNKL